MCFHVMPIYTNAAFKTWRRRVLIPLLALAYSAVVGCADAPFERGNAYDTRFSIPGTIIGLPDSITAVGDTVQLSLETSAEFRNVPRQWYARPLDPLSSGSLRVDDATGRLVASPSLLPSLWEVRAQMGAQQYLDTVTLRQVATRFRMFCPVVCEFDAHHRRLIYSVRFANLLDANGVPLALNGLEDDTVKFGVGATLAVRDTTILSLLGDTLRSRATDGTTWVIRRQFGYADSLRWTVRQRIAGVNMACPPTVAKFDSVRAPFTAVDPAGTPMASPVTVTWSVARYEPGTPLTPMALPGGTFVPAESGDWLLGVVVEHPTGRANQQCVIRVP